MKSTIFKVSPSLLLITAGFTIVLAENEDILAKAGPVVFSHILYRHGARNPETPYPYDPYKNESYWPLGWGQLTSIGKLQHYRLGEWLRKRYDHLIPGGEYLPKVLYVQSTDVDRTLMSALANLAGMFPPPKDEDWGPIKWQPIPVHTIPQTEDRVLAMKSPCPKRDELYSALLKSKFVTEFNEQHKDLYKYIHDHAGYEEVDILITEYLYSILGIQKEANLTLPDWATSIFPEKMEPVAAMSFALATWTKGLQRLRTGPLIGEIIKHMTDKISGQLVPDRNLWVYSAHDTTVADILNTLGVFEMHPPPFTATVLIELRRAENYEYSVTVLYKHLNSEPSLLTLPGCAAACPLDQFIALYQDIIPTDIDAECHHHQLFDLTSDQPYNSIAVFEDSEKMFERAPHFFYYKSGKPYSR